MRQASAWLTQGHDEAERAVGALYYARELLETAARTMLVQTLQITTPPAPVLTLPVNPASMTPHSKRSGVANTGAEAAERNWLAIASVATQQHANLLADWHAAQVVAEQKRAELRGRAARAQLIADRITDAARVLTQFLHDVEKARIQLLKAARLYEDTENTVLGLLHRALSTSVWPFTLGVAGANSFSEWLIPSIAPYSDDLIKNLSGGNVAFTASVLSLLAHKIVPPSTLMVTEIVPGHGELLNCPSPMPNWQGIPSNTILNLFNRVGDLHPFDPTAPPSGIYPECSRTGLPKGTIAIEKITRQIPPQFPYIASPNPPLPLDKLDKHRGHGKAARNAQEPETSRRELLTEPETGYGPEVETTWVVMIPGTQNFTPGEHAFDGVTDLDLMADVAPSQVSQQVMRALELAEVPLNAKVMLIGHSLGGIAAVSIAASKEFENKYQLAGVITAGSPTATFKAQPGVPYLHLENDEEIVSNLDGKGGDHGPASDDRIIITRQLSASNNPIDQNASKSLTGAHPIETHQRTLELALETGDPAVHNIVNQLETQLIGTESETKFFTGRRVPN